MLFIGIILQTYNPSKTSFAIPHHSTEAFTPKGQLFVFAGILLFTLYIGLRVWWSLRKDKKNDKSS